jgi:hypothetical protein
VELHRPDDGGRAIVSLRVRTKSSADAFGDVLPVAYGRPRWALYGALLPVGGRAVLNGHAAPLSAVWRPLATARWA